MEKDTEKLLTLLGAFQIGVQVEENIKALCNETIPLKFFDEYDLRRICTGFLNKPTLSSYAAILLAKMDELELKRPEIEEAEEKKKAELRARRAAQARARRAAIKEKAEKAAEQAALQGLLALPVTLPDVAQNGQQEASSTVPTTSETAGGSECLVPSLSKVTIGNSDRVSEGRIKVLTKRQSKNRKNKKRKNGQNGAESEFKVPNLLSSAPNATVEGSARARKPETFVLPPIPHVYNQNYLWYEMLYYEATEKKFKDQMQNKPEDMTWTAYFKQLHRAEIAAAAEKAEKEGAEDVIYVSGPTPTTVSTSEPATTETPNAVPAATPTEVASLGERKFKQRKPRKPNEAASSTSPQAVSDTTSTSNGPSEKPSTSNPPIATFRVNPNFWPNRHKYM